MVRFVVALGIVCAYALAGCAEAPEESAVPEDAHAADPPQEDGGIARPTWAVGDWWTYDVTITRNFGGPVSLTLQPTIVVVAADGNGYVTGLTDRDDLFTRTNFGDVWGGKHRLDLDPAFPYAEANGDVTEVPFNLYEWPLEPARTWTASNAFQYGGAEAEASITFTVEGLDNGTAGREARVVGVGPLEYVGGGPEDSMTIQYAWGEAERNVRSLVIENATTRLLEMTLVDHGTNHTGDVRIHEMTNVYFGVKGVAPPPASQPATAVGFVPAPERFTTGEGHDFIGVLVGVGLFTPGHAEIRLADPDNQMMSWVHGGGGGGASIFLETRDPVAGDWAVGYVMGGVSFGFIGVSEGVEHVVSLADGVPG